MLRPKIVALVISVAIAAVRDLANAQTPPVVEVDSDAPEVISRDAVAERIARELSGSNARATILIRYRDGERSLVVRATREDGRTVERAVKAEGDAAAVQREAVLLAGNVARDEARELLDALAARAPAPPSPPPPEVLPPPAEVSTPREAPAPREEAVRIVNVGVAYPLSANFGRPSITTYFDLSLAFGLVGKVKGVQLGSGGVAAAAIRGVQLAPLTIADDVEGMQLGVVNTARRVRGAQLGLLNIAEEVDGGAVGIVSISRDSIHPIAWVGNLGYFNAGIAFESTWLYTVLAFTYGSLETGLEPTAGGVGAIGSRLRVYHGLDVGLESSFSAVEPVPSTTNGSNTWFSQRALVGWRFARRARVFAGVGFRAPIAVEQGSHAVRPDFIGGFEL